MTLSSEMRQLTQHCLSAYDDRMATVAGIRSATTQDLGEFRSARQSMAAEQRQQLGEYTDGLHRSVEDLRSDAATFLKGAGAAHQAMSTEQRQQMGEYMDGLRRSVKDLRSGAATFHKELNAAHQAMATEQRQRLGEERTFLASGVITMRNSLQAGQDKLRAELGEARRVWTSFTTLMGNRRSREAPPAPEKETSPPPPMEGFVQPLAVPIAAGEEESPDDLTALRGIGPAMQRHLNQAGIYTYAQLAGSKPEELRQVIGKTARLRDVEEWIEQARDRCRWPL